MAADSFEALLGALARAPEKPVTAADLPAGKRVGRYTIVEQLGRGAMGAVYRARDSVVGRDVALKLLFTSPGTSTVDRFRREVVALGSVSHENIVAVHDAGIDEGQPYVVLELVEGETLRERLRRGPLSATDAARLAHDLVCGLGAAHAVGVVHRDLKPENVLLDAHGTAKIVDFGLARLVERDDAHATGLTESGMLLGTAHYMSPEQVRGQRVDHRADYFALGAVLYEALTGRRAFEAESRAEVITMVLRDQPRSEPELLVDHLARRLLGVAFRCLAKDASARFATASELLTALETDNVTPPPPRTDVLPETRYATSSGVHIAYQVLGDADRPSLVVAPPLTSNVEMIWEWPGARDYMRALASFTRYVHFDKRGAGMSDPVSAEATLDERVEDLRAVMDAAGVQRAFLGGISDGGPVCIAFAVKYPERTRSLVLVDAWAKVFRADGYDAGPTREQWDKLLDKWVERWGTPATLSLPLFVASRKDNPEFARWASRYERQCNSPGTFRRLMGNTLAADVRDLLPQLRCPVLVIHRRGDPAIAVEHGRYLAQHIPGAQYHELDGIDHVPWEGDTAAIVALIRAHIESVTQAEDGKR
jgi:pimeloyl-ACP methyl ester carboxylesterase